jgi:hypothetical protein
MKKTLIALALSALAASSFALDIGVGVAGANGTSATSGGAVAGGTQGSLLFGVSAGHQDASSAGGAENTTLVNSTGGTTTSLHEDTASANQNGFSFGLAGQNGGSLGTSTSSASGSFGLLKGFVFVNP